MTNPTKWHDGAAEERGRSPRTTATITAAAGAAHALLFCLSFYLLSDAPGSSASDQEILNYYSSGSDRFAQLAGLYAMPFAAIAFLWFISSLRVWTTTAAVRVDPLSANVQLISGVLYLAVLLVAAAAMSVTAASKQFNNGEIDPQIARSFPQYGAALLAIVAVKMGATFVLSTSNIGRSTGALPRWFAIAGLLVGVFMLLSATLTRALVLVFPMWLLILSAIILLRGRRTSAGEVLPAAGIADEGELVR